MSIFVEIASEDVPLLVECRDLLYALGKKRKSWEGYALAESAMTLEGLIVQVDDHYVAVRKEKDDPTKEPWEPMVSIDDEDET